jgi:flagellar motor switch protein FliN/FliY
MSETPETPEVSRDNSGQDSPVDEPRFDEAPVTGGTAVATEEGEGSVPLATIQPGGLKNQKDENGDPLDLEFILDIPLSVSVEVGRTRMMIQDLMALGKGSVIELNKLLGEPFEVLVNEKLIARGEVVVVNDRFGIRLTDIVSPNERVQTLA